MTTPGTRDQGRSPGRERQVAYRREWEDLETRVEAGMRGVQELLVLFSLARRSDNLRNLGAGQLRGLKRGCRPGRQRSGDRFRGSGKKDLARPTRALAP